MKNKKRIRKICACFLFSAIVLGVTSLISPRIFAENVQTNMGDFTVIKLPDYMIKTATYTLPDFYLADNVYVKVDGGDKISVNSNTYNVEGESSLEFFYDIGENTYSHYATVVDVNYGKDIIIENYFAVTQGQMGIVSDDSCTTLSFENNTSVQFINYLDVTDLNIEFEFTDSINYGKMKFILEDVVTGKTVTTTYTKPSKAWTATVGETTKRVNTSDGYAFGFNSTTNQVVFNSRIFVDLLKYDDGSEFVGFTDNVVNLIIEFEDVTASSTLELYSINKQSLTNIGRDFTAPRIIVDTVSTDAYHKDTFTLNAGHAIDVLDPNVKFTVSVIDVNGDFVIATNGTVLNGVDATVSYGFVLNDYGLYTVSYTAVDGALRKQNRTNQISVVDDIEPEITVGEKITEGKVGEKINVATMSYSDNVTATNNLIVNTYVMLPSLVMQSIDGDFTPTEKGTYTVMYVVIDEMYNLALESYEVEVK